MNHPQFSAQRPMLGHAALWGYSTPFYENIPRDGYSTPPKKKRTKKKTKK